MNDVKDKLEKTKSKDHKDHKEKKDDRNVTSNQETGVTEEVEELDATNVDVEDDDSLLAELAEVDSEDDEIEFTDDDEEVILEDEQKNTGITRTAAKNFAPATEDNPANFSIKFANTKKPLSGTINLCCIVLKWKDHKAADSGQLSATAREAAKTYESLSNGELKVKYTVKIVDVGLNYAKKNLNKAEAKAVKTVNAQNKGPKYTMYALANNNLKGGSNAGRIYAHLGAARSLKHEMGHIIGNPLDKRDQCLGHTGVLGKGAYDDGSSFMGKFPSSKITASQKYHLGWFKPGEVALYNEGDPATDFKVQQLYADKTIDGTVRAVKIDRGDLPPMFFSAVNIFDKKANKSNPACALHIAYGGGSQRVGSVFAKEREYAGIKAEVIEPDGGDGETIVRISSVPRLK